MPIYDRSYRRWDGQLKRRTLAWWPVATTGIRMALRLRSTPLRNLLFYGLLFGSQIPFVLLLLLNYAYHFPPASLVGPQALDLLQRLAPFKVAQYPLLVWFTNQLLMIFTVLFGSGLIAQDRASSALPLYLSRPLSLGDYLLGKFAVVAFFLCSISLFPCLLLWLFDVFATDEDGYLWKALPQLGGILAHAGSVVAVYAVTVLAASSCCRRAMVAGLLWFGGFMTAFAMGTALSHVTGVPEFYAVSPVHAAISVAWEVFHLDSLESLPGGVDLLRSVGLEPYAPLGVSAGALAAYVVLSLYLLLRVFPRRQRSGEE